MDLDSGGKDLDLDLHGEDLDLDLDSGGKDLDLDLDLNFEDLTTSLRRRRWIRCAAVAQRSAAGICAACL